MRNWPQRNLCICFCAMCLLLVGDALGQQAEPSPSGGIPIVANASVPRLIRFSGIVKDAQGQPRTGVVGITFALYKDQEGGAALWQETQNVGANAQGHYEVLLGSTLAAGIPTDAFSANEARWLGIQPEGQAEQRVLLVSVPYALKAADAETLGGMPASAFVLAAPPANAGSGGSGSQSGGTSSGSTTATSGTPANGITPNSTCTSGSCAVSTNSPGGTANFVPLFTDPTTVQNSILAQAPCPFNNALTCLGVNTTTPVRALDVAGEVKVGGGNVFFQRDLGDLAGRRNWAWGTETFNVGDMSLFVSTTNTGYVSINPVFTALSNGFMGVGVGTPHANLEVAGTGGGLLVDSPGYITGNGSGLTNLNAASLSSGTTIPSGVNGSGLTNLTAANLTGTIPTATLQSSNVALVNASNTFSASNAFTAPQAVTAAPGGTGAALAVGATGNSGVNGLVASTNDPSGVAALFTNTGSVSSPNRAYILEAVDSTGNYGFRVNANGLESTVPLAQRITNDATGTTLNTLVSFTNSGTVATIPTNSGFSSTGATGAIGIVVADNGTSGKATVAFTGFASCLFDNTTPTIVGDYVVPSVTAVSSPATAGYCHDNGQNVANGLPDYPLPGVQIVGRVISTNASSTCTSAGGCAGTAAQIFLYGFETRSIGQVGGYSASGLTAAISPKTLFTPLVNELFRVNIYMTTTAGSITAGNIQANVTWADENGAQSLTSHASLASQFQLTSTGVYAQGTLTIHVVPGTPILFTTTLNSVTGSPTYEAFVTMERLQ